MAASAARYAEHERKLAHLFDILAAAASKGAPCPSNYELCGDINLSSPGNAAYLVCKIETRGLIRVERLGSSRRVTIVSTGQSTAPVRGVPVEHRKGAAREPGAGNVGFGFRGERPEHLYVDRDPCPRCGVRRDAGCAHRPARLGMVLGL